MNIRKITERARGFVQSALSLAMRDGHQRVSRRCIGSKYCCDDSEGLAGGLIDRAGGNSRALSSRATEDAGLKKLPKVPGSGAGQIYLAPDMARVRCRRRKGRAPRRPATALSRSSGCCSA